MFCSKCGNQLTESASFCSKCGTQQGASATPAQLSTPAAVPRHADNTGLGRLIITGGSNKRFTGASIFVLTLGVFTIVVGIAVGNLAEWELSTMGLFFIIALILGGGWFLFSGYTSLSKTYRTEISVFENGIKGISRGKRFKVHAFEFPYDKIARIEANVVQSLIIVYHRNGTSRWNCYVDNVTALEQAIQERLKQAK